MINTVFVVNAAITADDVTSKLVPNFWNFLTQFLAFILMSLIVIKLLYKPVAAFIARRKAYIQDNLENAAKQNKQAQDTNAKAYDNLLQSKKQATEIVMEAKRQAEEEKQADIQAYKNDLIKRRIAAEKEIEDEKKQAMSDVKGQMVDIALAASANLLSREVSTADNRRLVTKFVDDMSKKQEANQQ